MRASSEMREAKGGDRCESTTMALRVCVFFGGWRVGREREGTETTRGRFSQAALRNAPCAARTPSRYLHVGDADKVALATVEDITIAAPPVVV